MMIDAKGLSLRLKLSAIVVTVIGGVMGVFGYLASDYLDRSAVDQATRQLEATNRLIRDLIGTSQDGMQIAVGKLGETLRERFHGHFTLDEGHPVTGRGLTLPRLNLDGRTLDFDYAEIDAFSRDSGGNVATIFARDGDDFVRISTSLAKEDGSRAVGTRLGKRHPAYARVLAGEAYQGHARLFGRHYMTAYLPVLDDQGRTIALLFVGMDLSRSLDVLRQKLRQFVIGDSGYVIVLDAEPGPDQARYVVHPTLEGWQAASDDTSVAAQVTREILRRREGPMFYEWASEPDGATGRRQKIAALDVYPELNWVIGSTGYLDEFTGTARAGQRYMIVATAIASLLLIAVLNLAVGRLVLLPMLREISERRRAEAALRESEAQLRSSEARYRLLLDHSPLGILQYDMDLVVGYCNSRFAAIMQVPQRYVFGLRCRELRDQRIVPALQQATMGDTATYEGPYRTSYAGLELQIAMTCAPVRDANGGIVGGIAIIQDITERLAKDAELARYRDHLEELVAERTRELTAARTEAERLARVKSEFLANMSHEIRTPLNGVLGMAQIGYRQSSGRTRSQEIFGKILRSGKLLLGIINDILDFSKIEAGKLHIDETIVLLRPLLDHAVELVADRAREKGIELVVDVPADLPDACRSDPLRIGQILMNLLANAVKFTESGRVTLAIAREADCLVFRVSDTGIGIAADQLERIFSAFEQADGSTTRRFGGTGLGLAITSRLVDLLGGRITVDSTPGLGSCFEVSLPFVAATTVERSGNAGVPLPGLAGRRLAGLSILVAEDNEINRAVVLENLSEEGAAVVLAANGQEAVDQVIRRGSDAFDVVLMDLQMPVMDGCEATRRILELAPALPVIGQTAHTLDEERRACFAAGMVAHIAKPIDPEELVEVILEQVTGAGTDAAVN